MSIIPTIRVKRPDGNGYHLVNAPLNADPSASEEAEPVKSNAPVARKPRSKAKAKK